MLHTQCACAYMYMCVHTHLSAKQYIPGIRLLSQPLALSYSCLRGGPGRPHWWISVGFPTKQDQE